MKKISLFVAALLLIMSRAFPQLIDTSPSRVNTTLDIPFEQIGTIKPKTVNEIEASNWTIGCEVLDRDYADFDAYREYLPLLGIKKIRLQGGWAKTEKRPGVYDWAWLDSIIDYAVANGLKPWLEASYGNSLYNSGGVDLGGSIPITEEALTGWDRWVEAMVVRYKDKVTEWEIWNEPSGQTKEKALNTPERVAMFNIRTAEIIKRIQPHAEIAGLAMGSGNDTVYLDGFLKAIAEKDKLDLFKWITFHGYTMNPDDAYTGQARLEATLRKYSDKLLLRQGENGAPSAYCPEFALRKYNWTEISQAKWNARRMLGDLGRDIESSVFSIIDMYYKNKKVLNVKGIIQSDTTLKALRPKTAFYTVQNIASVFDNTLERIRDFKFSTNTTASLSVFGYRNKTTGRQIIALWFDGNIPGDTFETRMVEISVSKGKFRQPVWVDLFSGRIYRISDWHKKGSRYTFNIPVYDSPVLIADLSLINH
jgi:hypothetical protein